jgi:hypothetical protein
MLGEIENNSSTPILSSKSFSRSVSSESGKTYCQYKMNAWETLGAFTGL